MSSSVAFAGLARSEIGMRFISRSATLKMKQRKIVSGAVCKLRDSRASSGRTASPNKNKKLASLFSFGNTVTDEPSSTSEDGLLSYLISCAVGAGKFTFAIGTVVHDFFMNSNMMATFDGPLMAKTAVVTFWLIFLLSVFDPLPQKALFYTLYFPFDIKVPSKPSKTRRWEEVVPALRNMVEAARQVRAEIAGTSKEVSKEEVTAQEAPVSGGGGGHNGCSCH